MHDQQNIKKKIFLMFLWSSCKYGPEDGLTKKIVTCCL